MEAYRTKSELAAARLRDDIRSGVMKPRERIDIEALGDLLGMSATPIREALRQLQADGFVINEPHRGARVADFSPEETAELYDLREVLESRATLIAADHLTAEDIAELEALFEANRAAIDRNDHAASVHLNEAWHMTIYAAAQNTPHLVDFIRRLWNDPRSATWVVPGRLQQSRRDHAAIMGALSAGDSKQAAELMGEHIRAGKNLVLRHLSRESPEVPGNASSAGAARG